MKAYLAAIPAALLVLACGEKTPTDTAQPTGPKLVRAFVAGADAAPESSRYSGEVRARHEAQLGFRVGGKMIERLVDAGAHVKAGQPLARLDPADARLAAAQAEAGAALAAADLGRTRELRDKNFVSQAALDARVTAAKSADAQAQLARNQAAYTTLTADAPGVVAAVLAEPGQVLAAGQGAFRIARDGEREAAIALPEAALPTIRPGSAAEVRLWADGRTYAGNVREIAPAADPATRTFAARIAIKDAEPDLPLGMTATVNFPQQRTARIVVPLAAIFQQGNRPAVWLIGKDDAVELRPVEVERYADQGAILRGGLREGERVVAAGAFRLTAGEKVRIAEDARK